MNTAINLLLVAVFVFGVSSPAWPAAETLRPNGDDVGESSQRQECGTTGCEDGGVDCWADLDEDPDTADDFADVSGDCGDASGCTGSGCSANYDAGYGMTDPTGCTVCDWHATNNQTIKVRWQHFGAGGAAPSGEIRAYCAGVDQTIGCTPEDLPANPSWTVAECTFTDSDVTCGPDDIQIGYFCDGSGGTPAGRRTCIVSSIELNADVIEATTAKRAMVIQ